MKHLAAISMFAISILYGCASYAGTIEPPWIEREPTPPPVPEFSWSGVGVGMFARSSERSTEYQRETGSHQWECVGDSSTHSGDKCAIHSAARGLDLEEGRSPWKTNPQNDGEYDGAILYEENGEYSLVWLDSADGGDAAALRYTTEGRIAPPNVQGKDAILSYLGPVTEVLTETETETGAGIYANYRHDFGKVVAGAEIQTDGDLHAAFGTIGLDLGRAHSYLGLGDSNEGRIEVAGVDLMIGYSGLTASIQVSRTDQGANNLDLRAGLKF